MKLKLLHLNTTKPKNQTKPNTLLNEKLHYEMIIQTDADESITQNMLQYANMTQIYDQMNNNINTSQNQQINEHKLNIKAKTETT